MNSLEFAINIEKEGQKFYEGQAEINKTNGLHALFLILARDEEAHAQILQSKFHEVELKENTTLAQSETIFSKMTDFKHEISEIPNQQELYRAALAIEKQSAELYEKLLSQSSGEEEKKVFAYLIKQEQEHYDIIERIITLINRPDEWVESAEFGVREEY